MEVRVAASMAGQWYRSDREAWYAVTDRCAPFFWQVCQRHQLTVAETEKLAEAVWHRLMRELELSVVARELGRHHPALVNWVTTAAEDEYNRLRMDAMDGQDEPPTLLVAPALLGRRRSAFAGFSVRSLTSLAAWLAGREGPVLRDESKSHLAGENGHDRVSWAKVSEAAGFVIAGVRYRGQNWAETAWRPADVVLRSRFLSGLFVAIPTIVAAAEVLTHKGTMTVLTSFGSIFGIGTALAGAIKAGRKYRDVEPPEPKARQASKDDWGA